jgi:hypothetical protein
MFFTFVLLSEKETGSAEAQPVRDRITDGNKTVKGLSKVSPLFFSSVFSTGIFPECMSMKTLGFGAKPQ